MGSGKYLLYAQRKYGIENFTKDILFVYDNASEMYAKEAEIVNDEFLTEENTYNLKRGGFGGFDYINAGKLNRNNVNGDFTTESSIPANRIKSDLFAGSPELKAAWIASISAARSKSASRPFLGRTHTHETKIKMAESARLRLSTPANNSQFGTMWITNGSDNRKIKKIDSIPAGWSKGRVQKNILGR